MQNNNNNEEGLTFNSVIETAAGVVFDFSGYSSADGGRIRHRCSCPGAFILRN